MNVKNPYERNTFSKRDIFVLVILTISTVAYFIISPKVVIDPIIEADRMDRLEETKKDNEISIFETDGCSENISEIWNLTIEKISNISDTFKEKNSNISTIPFEGACVIHDQTYHRGIGGYEGRLLADNRLRSDIILYGMNNVDEIQSHTELKTKEDVIFLYEAIAEAIYRGVRVGGSPCTGKPYAWGFGYNDGVCN